MSIEIKIAVHPAVPKFLSYRYKVLPFLVCRLNPYSIILHNSLSRDNSITKQHHRNLKESVYIDIAIYSAELRLLISSHTIKSYGWYISPKKVIDFSKLVLDFIDQEFYLYMDHRVSQGNKIYHSILAFREKYNLLEEDLAAKTLEKKYERYRRQLKA